MENVSAFTGIISAFLAFMRALADFGVSILKLFGIPEIIRIGNLTINTGGIFTAVITIGTFFVLASMLKDYIKWILLGALLLFGLSVLSSLVTT
jgi:hypothetical protein